MSSAKTFALILAGKAKRMSALPKLSIIIPARNEERYIGNCLDSINAAAEKVSTQLEIIVVLNRCSDKTEEIAKSRGCLVVSDERKNLACIRNTGVKASRAPAVLTIDADSRMSPNMLACIMQCLADEKIIGGGVLILPERWSLGIFLTALCLLPIIFWYGISGGLFFFRRVDFDAIGGFNESLASVEDIDFARRLKAYARKSRRRFVNLYRAHIVSSCRKFDRLGDWYFLRRPGLFLTLLRGRNQAAADHIWYDFEH